jgi:hypothetical protein
MQVSKNKILFLLSISITPFVWFFWGWFIFKQFEHLYDNPGIVAVISFVLTIGTWVSCWILIRKHKEKYALPKNYLLTGGLIITLGFLIFSQMLWGLGWHRLLNDEPLSKSVASSKLDNEPAMPALFVSPLPNDLQLNLSEQSNVSSDPLIDCVYPHSGRLRVKQSECAGTKVDCEVEPGKWQVVWNTDCQALREKEKRIATQRKEIEVVEEKQSAIPTPAITSSLVTCELSYGTYQLSSEYCNEAKNRDMKLGEYSSDISVDYEYYERLNQEALARYAAQQQQLVDEAEQASRNTINSLSEWADEDEPCLPAGDYGMWGAWGISRHGGCN